MSRPGGTAHVLVVDDDEPLAAALRRVLEYEGFRVSVSHDGRAALDLARREGPDVVVLDLMLPVLDGVSVCQHLRAEGIGTFVLMLTARDATADRVRGLDAGADDYLAKPFAQEELLARVRALLRRGASARDSRVFARDSRVFARDGGASARDDGQLRLGDLTLDPLAHEVRRGDQPVALTAQEFDLLRHFLCHPRQVLTRAQLLDAVWGLPVATASNVVDVYVGYLRAKLEIGGQSRLIHTVRGVGYVLKVA